MADREQHSKKSDKSGSVLTEPTPSEYRLWNSKTGPSGFQDQEKSDESGSFFLTAPTPFECRHEM